MAAMTRGRVAFGSIRNRAPQPSAARLCRPRPGPDPGRRGPVSPWARGSTATRRPPGGPAATRLRWPRNARRALSFGPSSVAAPGALRICTSWPTAWARTEASPSSTAARRASAGRSSPSVSARPRMEQERIRTRTSGSRDARITHHVAAGPSCTSPSAASRRTDSAGSCKLSRQPPGPELLDCRRP